MNYLVAFNNGEQSKPFRDKVAKTCQYLAKILSEVSKNAENKKSFAMMAANISIARRIYRWGQVSGSIQQLIKLFNNKSLSSVEYCRLLALYIASFLSQSFDMLCYIYMLRSKKIEVERCSYWCQLFYFITCAIEFIHVFFPFLGHVTKLLQLSSQKGPKAEQAKADSRTKAVNTFLDASKKFGDGVTAIRDVLPGYFEPYGVAVAASGFTSGAVAIYQSVPSLFP